jgi:hypothetical protein
MAFKIMQWFDIVGQVISDTLEKKQRSETELLLLRQRWGERLLHGFWKLGLPKLHSQAGA